MSPLPDVSQALSEFADAVNFIVISKGVDDYETIEKKADPEQFRGVFQPLSATKIKMLPENQRSWLLWELWTTDVLALDWMIEAMDGTKLRVLSVQDWGSYRQYALAENPTT